MALSLLAPRAFLSLQTETQRGNVLLQRRREGAVRCLGLYPAAAAAAAAAASVARTQQPRQSEGSISRRLSRPQQRPHQTALPFLLPLPRAFPPVSAVALALGPPAPPALVLRPQLCFGAS